MSHKEFNAGHWVVVDCIEKTTGNHDGVTQVGFVYVRCMYVKLFLLNNNVNVNKISVHTLVCCLNK